MNPFRFVQLAPNEQVPPVMRVVDRYDTSHHVEGLGPLTACSAAAWQGNKMLEGDTLAISQISAGSVAAAALWVLRYLRYKDWTENNFETDDRFLVAGDNGPRRARVRLLAERTYFAPGAPWQPRRLPSQDMPWPSDTGPVQDTQRLAAIHEISTSDMLPLNERVALAGCWLLYGEDPDQWGCTTGLANVCSDLAKACGSAHTARAADWFDEQLCEVQRAVSRKRRHLVQALTRGDFRIHVRPGTCACPAARKVLEVDGREAYDLLQGRHKEKCGARCTIAFVETSRADGLDIGYRCAPSVVVLSPRAENGTAEVSVNFWATGSINFQKLRYELNEAEISAGGVPCWVHGDCAIQSSVFGTKINRNEIERCIIKSRVQP